VKEGEIGSAESPIDIDSADENEEDKPKAPAVEMEQGQDFDSLPVIKVEAEEKKEDVEMTEVEEEAKKEEKPSTSTAPTKVEIEEDKDEKENEEEEDEFDEYNDGNILLGKRSKLKADLDALQKFLPQVEVKTLETPEGSGCTHVVTCPNKTIYIPLHPIEKPVKTYAFKLDLFQERAVQCVDNYQSVLVSAHTSAGKTVVAEYVPLSSILFPSDFRVLLIFP
jgi:superfamily II RNA helicase